jgi:4-carboxymuconolactone decarboxylase
VSPGGAGGTDPARGARMRPMTTHGDTRLAPVPFAAWDEHTRTTLLAHLRRPELYLSGAPDAPPMPVVLELFANHVGLSETFLTFSDALADAEARLDPKIRELAILRVAWRTRSGYEWNQHSRMARDEGLTEAQVRAVRDEPSDPVWTPEDRAVLAAADEMVDAFGIGQETWDRLAASLDGPQIFELLFVVGGYLCLATVLNSLGLGGEIATDTSETGAPT